MCRLGGRTQRLGSGMLGAATQPTHELEAPIESQARGRPDCSDKWQNESYRDAHACLALGRDGTTVPLYNRSTDVEP